MSTVVESKIEAEDLMVERKMQIEGFEQASKNRVLEFLQANNLAGRTEAQIKVDYEFLAINFDRKYWTNFAKEVAELRGDTPEIRTKKLN